MVLKRLRKNRKTKNSIRIFCSIGSGGFCEEKELNDELTTLSIEEKKAFRIPVQSSESCTPSVGSTGQALSREPLPISSFIEMTHKDTSDFVQVLKKEKQILYGKNAASL